MMARCPIALVLLACAGCAGPPRAVPNYASLQARAVESTEIRRLQHERLVERILGRMQREDATAAEGERPVFDVLMLSGGGQYGAFGAGVLRGWGDVEDPGHRRPEFDLVTGVSTGSLISPFAFAGSDEELERIENFYREVRPDLAVLRGMFFFLPWRESFFDVAGLERTLDEEIGIEELRELRAGHAAGRSLLVASTDIDLGMIRIWDLGHQMELEPDDQLALRRLRVILRASSSIPAAFPPVELDGGLHVDGGVTESLFVPTDVLEAVREAAILDLGHPLPLIRVWTIVNGKLNADLAGTARSWIAVAGRSSHVLSHFSTGTALRRLELFCRWLDAVGPLTVEFRFMALPDDFEIPPSRLDSVFDAELMADLATLGEELGRDPDAWREGSPRPESFSVESER